MQVKIGSLVKLYTILLLTDEPKHGYELMKELGAKLGTKISASQVYPFLALLEKNKLVKVEETGEREKKVYALTRDGRKFTAGILGRFGDLLQLAIEPKLSVCTHCGCKVYSGGHRETINGKEMTFCCEHCARAYRDHLHV